jgi:methionyl aminopeptidase
MLQPWRGGGRAQAPASDRSNQPFQHQPARNYGYFTDMALTVPVGKIDKQAQKLIKVAKKSLALGLAQAKPGNSLNNIGQAIQDYVESQGLAVVRDLVGHGVGTAVHEEPQVPNFKIKDNDFENVILQPGMTLAIEPMVSCGSWEIKNGSDGFSVVTADNSLSAHFEHTVAIGPKGGEVLTAL